MAPTDEPTGDRETADESTSDSTEGTAFTPAESRLLLDVMLGKLATYLRMCGYDAAYALDRDAETDDAALALAEREGRLLLTRDAQLAARADRSLLLRSRDITDQLRELRAAGFELSLTEPARCATCNGELVRVPEPAGAHADDREPGATSDYAPSPAEEPVWRCRDCGQYFWRGSHWDDVAARLDELEG